MMFKYTLPFFVTLEAVQFGRIMHEGKVYILREGYTQEEFNNWLASLTFVESIDTIGFIKTHEMNVFWRGFWIK